MAETLTDFNAGAESPLTRKIKANQEKTRKNAETSAPAMPWAGQRVRLEDLDDFKRRWGLKVVGGDPDLDGNPWQPKLYFVPAKTGS